MKSRPITREPDLALIWEFFQLNDPITLLNPRIPHFGSVVSARIGLGEISLSRSSRLRSGRPITYPSPTQTNARRPFRRRCLRYFRRRHQSVIHIRPPLRGGGGGGGGKSAIAGTFITAWKALNRVGPTFPRPNTDGNTVGH